METVEIDLGLAVIRAEEMLGGLSDNTLKLHDFSAAVALIIGTMSNEYDVDSMILVQEIESMLVQIEEL